MVAGGEFRIEGDHMNGDPCRKFPQQGPHSTTRICWGRNRLVTQPHAHRRLLRIDRRDDDTIRLSQNERRFWTHRRDKSFSDDTNATRR